MKKYNLSNIMKRAWQLVKEAGSTMSEALKKAWREAKEVKSSVKEYLESKGLKVWKKNDKERIYINDLSRVADIDAYTCNPKSFRKVSAYYDVKNDKFVYSVSSSREETMKQSILGIREAAC